MRRGLRGGATRVGAVAIMAALFCGASFTPAGAATAGTVCKQPGATAQSSYGKWLFCATTNAAGVAYKKPHWRVIPGGLVPLVLDDAPHNTGYNRATDFGGWIDADHDCQNTRTEVLIQESLITPTFSTPKSCTVTAGEWRDPWSGVVSTAPGGLDIDHMVPLGNAWASGAWQWTQDARVAYANNLAQPEHLHAILAGENRAKGDLGPEGWKPANSATWCQYAQEWDTIKNRYALTATSAEWNALLAMAAHC